MAPRTERPERTPRTTYTERSRRDGWTPARQTAFLAALSATRSVTAAARAAGMSRESAHRLRGRRDGTLFAHLWDLALAGAPQPVGEGHAMALADGQLERLLGNHFRRQSGEYGRTRAAPAVASRDNRA